MIAVLVNALGVVIGAVLGTVFSGAIREKYTERIITVMAIVTVMLGVQSTLGTSNILIVIVCLVPGTLIGTRAELDRRMNGMSDRIREKLSGTRFGNGRFTEAFITTTILFCVGSMTVIGSIQAGLNHEYGILLTKTIMDTISAIAFAAALGPGVLLSSVSVLVIQGGIALLAGVAQPLLTDQVITEMTAVGGIMLFGLGINLLGISEKKIPVGDMIPGLFLPILYFPLAELVRSVF